MYVDDDTDILAVTKLCLNLVGGFEVITWSTATDAIEQIRKEAPDMLLLDVMMPGVDGPTIIKALLADPELWSIPVIFMTARVQPQEIIEYLSYGAASVIEKPFDPMQLCAQVTEVWNNGEHAMD